MIVKNGFYTVLEDKYYAWNHVFYLKILFHLTPGNP